MNSHHSLELALKDILLVVNPTHDDWNKRFQIINDLQAVVQTLEILRGATVEPFGSFVSNLFTKWGDLDVSVELPNGSYISAAGKKYKQTLLLDILKALKRKGGFHGIKCISHARVPILKCDSNKDNISCDISINNLSGQMKSKVLFWINEIDGRFRDMVLLVKEWAKAHGINDPKSGTLNSYSLSLLIIFHFQTCTPAILPPLSEIYPGNVVADLTGIRAVAEKNIEDMCGMNINRIKSDRSRRINRSSLAELFVSFLAKFRDISLRASTQGISPYNGQWEDINTNMIWQPKTYALFIEDPFEQPMNCARAVGHLNLVKIAQAFESSHGMLASAYQNHHPLAVLVRPEVLSIISRSQFGNPLRIHPQLHVGNGNGNGRGLIGDHPQSFRNSSNNGSNQHQNRDGGGSRAPTHVQQQYMHQTNRVNPRHVQMFPNGVNESNGRPSSSQTQLQQIWRPRSEK
ncbi:protein HESO1 isoform X1 [Cynara cardunculus var. scolymus]|nr:protein HESO1 isoform X1 [Cynara cardunculus var. scolymus]XP_024990022.1 protein HESO1 isoform X1 [Cynara cardunculus var. scolymus]